MRTSFSKAAGGPNTAELLLAELVSSSASYRARKSVQAPPLSAFEAKLYFE